MTQRNMDFAIRLDGHDKFSIMASSKGADDLLASPLLESVNRESLSVLRSLINDALNTSAEELSDEL